MREEIISKKAARRKTIIAFLLFFLFASAGVYAWIKLTKQPQNAGIPKTLRKGLEKNEQIFGAAYSNNRLARTYPKSEAVKKVRVNGNVGMNKDFDAESWRLNLIKTNGDSSFFTMEDIRKLPKTEIVYDFKCIEGWSQKTWWGGVKFSDFVKHYHLDKEAALKYIGLITPDRKYYVGIDMPSALHPQTLLCYEMNGKPLPMNQGYPLRLIIPVKYGIKSIKRIGTIFFSDQRPPDYWAERGYDYYAGH